MSFSSISLHDSAAIDFTPPLAQQRDHALAHVRLIINHENQRVGHVTIDDDLTVRLTGHKLLASVRGVR